MGLFDKVMSVYSQKIAIKKLLSGVIPDMQVPSKSCFMESKSKSKFYGAMA